jgi:molybdopterin-guanine dinucleotide biosynthesis protein A
MGSDKSLIQWGATTLLERAVDVLAGVCDEVVVAGGSSGPNEVVLLTDTVPDAGPLGGIDAAYRHAAGRPLLVLAVDMPLIDREILEHLITTPIDPQAVRIMVAGGRDQPLCGLYGSAVGMIVRETLTTVDRSMAQVLKRVETVERVLADPEKLLNVNTTEDLEQALRRSGLPPSTH